MRNGDPDWPEYEDMSDCTVIPSVGLGKYTRYIPTLNVTEPDFDSEYRLAMKQAKKKDRARHTQP